MDKKRIEIVLTFLLSIIFVLVIANSIRIAKRRFSATAVVSTATVSQPAVQIGKGIPQRPEGKLEELPWGRCPFSGKAYASSGKPILDLKLTGIIWDEKIPQALINNKIVKAGDILGNYVVIKIDRNSVILNNGAEEIELRLGQ